MAVKKNFAHAEMRDGRTFGARVTLATQMQWETTAPKRGWSAEKNPVTLAAFLCWHATKVAGHHDLGFDDFLDQVVDVEQDTETPDDLDDLASESSPTSPAASTTSPSPSPAEPASPITYGSPIQTP